MTVAFCAYDNNGNLFVDGKDSSGNVMLAEMPKGSKAFTAIALDQRIGVAGTMQWDGKYLALEDREDTGAPVIYRFAISGSSGVKVSKTTLVDSHAHAQFWIQGDRIIGPVDSGSTRAIGYWRFPAGGSPIKSFSDTFPSGEAVSLK
jgi:hypothetical protein